MSIASIITPKEVSRGTKSIKALIGRTQKLMKKEAGDKEFVSMLRSDIKDFQQVIKLLRAKDVKRLTNKIEDMDTEPRDEALTRLGRSVSRKLGYD